MEQKKILWVSLSVVVFVVVVLGAGLIWFRPADVPTADGSAEAPNMAGTGFDAIEYIREGDSFPGLEEEAEGEAQEDFIAVSGEIVYGEDPAAEEGKESVETAPSETAAAVPAPVEAAPVVTARPAPPVQKSLPVPEPVRTPVSIIEYWIQAGSFQSTSRAQEVKGVLGDKGFSAVITTKDVGETTWFRVRVGPYMNKGEAEKFLEWIKNLEGFSESYISEVTITR